MRKASILLGCLLFACVLIYGLVLIASLAVVHFSSASVQTYGFPLTEKWQFVADNTVGATPAFYKDAIAFRTGQDLYVVEAATGTLRWSADLPGQSNPSPPVIANETIVVTHPKGITAYDVASGEVRWQVKEEWELTGHYPAAASDDVVVIAELYISIYDLRTGELLWHIINPEWRTSASVSLNRSELYLILWEEIRAYDVRTDSLLWSDTSNPWRSPYSVLEDNILYLKTGEGLGAFSIQNNKTLWLREDVEASRYPVAKQGDKLIVGTQFAKPVAMSASTGQTTWEALDVPSDIYQTPLVMGDAVYIRSLFRNRIYALSLQDGSIIGYLQLGPRRIIGAPDYAYSLGPIRGDSLIVFPVGKVLYAYGE